MGSLIKSKNPLLWGMHKQMNKQMNKLQILQSEQHSLKDRRINTEIQLDVAIHVKHNTNYILDDFHKCMWYSLYTKYSIEDLDAVILELDEKIKNLRDLIDVNGHKILKLRGGKWSF